MYLISDSRPTQDDVNKFVNVTKSTRSDVLSKRQAAKLRRKQDELVSSYTYTKEDIERNLQERKKSGKTTANLSLEQTRAELAVQGARIAIAEAQNRFDDAKRNLLELGGSDKEDALERAVDSARKELEQAKRELEARLEEQERVMHVVDKRKKKLTSRRNDLNWAKVNQRNKELNEVADFEAFKEQKARAEAEVKTGGQPKFNPYARRKVKPKMLWEVGQKEEKKDDDPKSTEMQVENFAVDKNGHHNDSAIKAAQAAKEAEKAAQSHQFNLDEDAEVSAEASFGVSLKERSRARMRKGISLTEYQQRKVAGTL